MKKLTMKNQCRHGDIFIERIASLPENLKSAGERSIILAEGTATGHKHVIAGDVAAFSDEKGNLYLKVGKKAELTHEEHATILFGEGAYRVVRQVEYGVDEAARQVAD